MQTSGAITFSAMKLHSRRGIWRLLCPFLAKILCDLLFDVSSPKKPLHLKKELFPLLEPVVFWLANALEYYNFLVTHSSSLHLPPPTSPDHTPRARGEGEEGEEEEQESAVSTLYNILVYAYQQAFYSVSKVSGGGGVIAAVNGSLLFIGVVSLTAVDA